MIVRPAIPEDKEGMSRVLAEIVTQTGSSRPTDPDHILNFYIQHPDRIECSVALDETGEILGFQSLKLAMEANIYDVTPGWGVIGSYVSPRAKRKGVGAALFQANLETARKRGLHCIDASIGRNNEGGQAYYERWVLGPIAQPKSMSARFSEFVEMDRAPDTFRYLR